MSQARTKKDVSIYQLKVTLKGSKPPIWRRVQVKDNIRLGDLHGVIQCVMGWDGGHLHQFIHQGQYFGAPSDDDEDSVTDEDKVRLSDLHLRAKSKFVYEYDFGDDWMHDIVVEKMLPVEKGVDYPRCIDGQRACPPDDCGGIWGFYDMLQAASDPKHPEHEDYKEWLGDEFDPEAFDLEAKDATLREAFKRPRTWGPIW
ncbi:MAG: plasmid pRiA4b ORF-3 family protein [Planctomycetota bacterium]